MSKEEIKDMIEPIPNWEFTYRYDGSRNCGKSYTQSLLDEKGKEIERLNKEVERLNYIKSKATDYLIKAIKIDSKDDNCMCLERHEYKILLDMLLNRELKENK